MATELDICRDFKHPDTERPQVELFASMFPVYQTSSPEIQKAIESMVEILRDPNATPDERYAAVDTLVEIFFPIPDGRIHDLEGECGDDSLAVSSEAIDKMAREEEVFSVNLRRAMEEKNIKQAQLAAAIGVGQPAVSMMLSRQCRPQRATIAKIAEALGVKPTDLWPK